jgi:hypothetical protein
MVMSAHVMEVNSGDKLALTWSNHGWVHCGTVLICTGEAEAVRANSAAMMETERRMMVSDQLIVLVEQEMESWKSSVYICEQWDAW